jgi:hypothetical protein
MRRLEVLVLIVIACVGSSRLLAADLSGQYLVGGGVGALPCTQFLNAMAEARQEGGLTSVTGADRIKVWANYVVGFETGYNFAMVGVRDIFRRFLVGLQLMTSFTELSPGVSTTRLRTSGKPWLYSQKDCVKAINDSRVTSASGGSHTQPSRRRAATPYRGHAP